MNDMTSLKILAGQRANGTQEPAIQMP